VQLDAALAVDSLSVLVQALTSLWWVCLSVCSFSYRPSRHWSLDVVTSRTYGHVISDHVTVTWPMTQLDPRYWVTSSTTIYAV